MQLNNGLHLANNVKTEMCVYGSTTLTLYTDEIALSLSTQHGTEDHYKTSQWHIIFQTPPKTRDR